MTRPRYELKRIGLFSAVKTLFLLGGFAGFLLGLFQWMMILFLQAAVQSLADSGAMPSSFELELLLEAIGGGGGVIFPLMGGVVGSVAGIIAAISLGGLYNVAARVWGGLEFEWSEVTPTASSAVVPVPAMSTPGQPTPLPSVSAVDNSSRPETPEPKPADDDDLPPRRPSSSMYE